ncbi:MAG: hypothetical protein ACKVQK_03030 [Burkholderiales bacterium]
MSIDSWEAISKRIYWDRDVPLARWRARISIGHRSYLPHAIVAMTPAEFVRFYGLSKFKRDWPAIRAKLPGETLKYAPVFDLAWSQAVGGSWNLRPTEDFYSIPEKRRNFLTQVARAPGSSIYQVAKSLGLQYRRAHDHAAFLLGEGKIRSVEVIEHGRRKMKLFPAYAATPMVGSNDAEFAERAAVQ